MESPLSVAENLPDKLRLLRMSRPRAGARETLTLRRLSRETGIPASTLSQWESGRFTPARAALYPLAQFYGINLNDLLDPMQTLEAGSDGVLRFRPSAAGEPAPGEALAHLPHLGAARAGNVDFWRGAVAAGLRESSLAVPVDWLTPGYGHFVLSVEGQSMQLFGILAGDLLVVEKNPLAKRGDIVIARTVFGDVLVKRYAETGREVILSPASADHDVTILDKSDVEILGVVRHVLRLNLPSESP